MVSFFGRKSFFTVEHTQKNLLAIVASHKVNGFLYCRSSAFKSYFKLNSRNRNDPSWLFLGVLVDSWRSSLKIIQDFCDIFKDSWRCFWRFYGFLKIFLKTSLDFRKPKLGSTSRKTMTLLSLKPLSTKSQIWLRSDFIQTTAHALTGIVDLKGQWNWALGWVTSKKTVLWPIPRSHSHNLSICVFKSPRPFQSPYIRS